MDVQSTHTSPLSASRGVDRHGPSPAQSPAGPDPLQKAAAPAAVALLFSTNLVSPALIL